jgi:hypothetical protein
VPPPSRTVNALRYVGLCSLATGHFALVSNIWVGELRCTRCLLPSVLPQAPTPHHPAPPCHGSPDFFTEAANTELMTRRGGG